MPCQQNTRSFAVALPLSQLLVWSPHSEMWSPHSEMLDVSHCHANKTLDRLLSLCRSVNYLYFIIAASTPLQIRTGYPAEKQPLVDFPLCSSRACLGKYSVLTIKRRLLARKGSRFSYLVLLEERIKERIVRRPRVVPKETGDHSSLSFPYVCRACLGKMMHFIYKWRKEWRFFTRG